MRHAQAVGLLSVPATLLPILVGLSILVPSCSNDAGPSESRGGADAWTLMFYDDAEFVGFDPLDSLAARVHSGPSLNVLVLQDTRDGPARLYRISEDQGPILIAEPGELNMGHPYSLYYLLNFARYTCPTERYLLALYDHGGGWRGACWDMTSQNDNLTMDEIKMALSDVGGVDLVLFTAPCLMGAVESAYELRNCTDVYVGSENLSGYCWWNEPMRDICARIHRDPDISNHELGEYIIESIRNHKDIWASDDWSEDFTMSAVRTDRIVELANALDTLAADYLSCPQRLYARLTWVYRKITMFNEECLDIGDFVDEILKVEEFDSTRARLQAVRACLEAAVIAECHGSKCPGTTGLTVYFPYLSPHGCSTLYGSPETGLDFAEHTHWDELLEAYQYPDHKTATGPPIATPLFSDGFTPRPPLDHP